MLQEMFFMVLVRALAVLQEAVAESFTLVTPQAMFMK
jgi:hypothetical protein